MEDLLLGRTIAGRYRLESLLGTGAMGRVYRSRHVLIDREAAIKILALEHRGQGHARAWFLREARAVNRVNHANIAEIYDFGETDDGLAYLVMELLLGDRLSDRIDGRPLEVGFALDVVEQTAAALARAHGLGVVHRDVKPEHVFLVDRGGRRDFVKLIDFGLAQVLQEGRLAARGSVFGTPAYLSPEQARGDEVTAQSDLYALGVVLYEMLTGAPPFASEDPDELIRCHLTVDPPDPAEACGGIDPELSRIVGKLLAKDLGSRYRDAHHLIDDCKRIQRRLGTGPVWEVRSDHTLHETPHGRGGAKVDAVASVALRASVFGRMAAAAYPSGNGPREVVEAVDALWAVTADLSRVEGELEVIGRWDENLRQRAREFAAEAGRRIEEISRLRSQLERQIEAAGREIAALEEAHSQASDRLASARRRLGDLDDGDPRLRSALEEAAAAAAEHQRLQEGLDAAAARVDRSRQTGRLYDEQIRRHRAALDRHVSLVEADLEAGRPRYGALVGQRDRLLERRRSVEALLGEHFRDRPECRDLLEQLRSIPDPGSGHGRPDLRSRGDASEETPATRS